MAATKKTGTAGAGEAAALPGRVAEARPADRLAAVIPLPGALLEPVTQQRRRGRNPKEVSPLWRKRMERAPELQALRLAAQLEHATAMRDECFERCNASDAILSATEKALKAATSKHWALLDEHERLAAEVKRLKAEQANALRWVATA